MHDILISLSPTHSRAKKRAIEQVASGNITAWFLPKNQTIILDYLDEVEDWHSLIEQIEYHGLAPEFYQNIKADINCIDTYSLRMLQGLTIKHRLRSEAHLLALAEIHNVFAQAKISFVLLKGAALGHQIYRQSAHRCMEDIDILVPVDQANDAQHVLEQSGYIFAPPHKGELVHHHHLPAAQKEIDQQSIIVELHLQALSHDMQTQIDFETLSEPLINLKFYGLSWQVLGHIDTLRLLCLHTFSRDTVIKLSGIVDLVRYATIHVNEIDWPRIKQDYNFIINTLRLCQCIVELPSALEQFIKPLNETFKHNIKGVGCGMVPLREFTFTDKSLQQRLGLLFKPPEWWMYVFYNISPESNLFFTRWFRHPVKVVFWVVIKQWQRVVSKSKINNQ